MLISGCITVRPGERRNGLIGVEVGASHLSVHVLALRKTEDGFRPFDDFAP